MAYETIRIGGGGGQEASVIGDRLLVSTGASGIDGTVSYPLSTTPVQTSVFVGTSNTSVLAANASRRFLNLVNDGVNTVYVAFGATASVNAGIRINPNGGNLFMDRYVPQVVISGIAIGSTVNLLITEG